MPRTVSRHPEERPGGARLEGRKELPQEAPAPLAVYIHWPFCRSKCPYCDFNSHVRERVDAARWTRALIADLERQAALVPDRIVTSIFFGGGTPSLMPPETVAALVERVTALWPVLPDLEVSLEANPNSAEAERFAGFAAAGINRLSLGIQALDPEALRFLGRGHDRDEAIGAIRLARASFARYSFDLIYARPGQSEAAWEGELDEALSLAGEAQRLVEFALPGSFALAGPGIDEVERIAREAGAGEADRPDRLVAVVPAAEKAQRLRIERLDPERQPVDAGGGKAGEALRLGRVGVGLQAH